MATSFAYYDLLEAFPQDGCAVCRLLLRDVDRYLDGLLYEYVNEADTHAAFRSGRGLCNTHSWQLRRYRGGALGSAILCGAALDEVLRTLERPGPRTGRRLLGNSGAGAALADALGPQAPCPACQKQTEAAARYSLMIATDDARLLGAYRDSQGLCLPHFRAVLRQANGREAVHKLVDIQREIWQRLYAEVQTFITRQDYRYSAEQAGEEGDSWLRVIATLAGEQGLRDER